MIEYKQLKLINIDQKDTKLVNGKFRYASWSTSWQVFIETYPNAYRRVSYRTDQEGNRYQYFGNSDVGYYVEVTIFIPQENNTLEIIETLAIRDLKNSPVKTGINITHIEDAIQRCTVKALARAGIGLNVYQNDYSDVQEVKVISDSKEDRLELFNELRDKINHCEELEYLHILRENLKQARSTLTEQEYRELVSLGVECKRRLDPPKEEVTQIQNSVPVVATTPQITDTAVNEVKGTDQNSAPNIGMSAKDQMEQDVF